MTLELIFLLEEPSMKNYLDQILPKILPPEVDFQTLHHRGCADLRLSIPRKLQNWNRPDRETRFVIVHDRDDRDCRALKLQLRQICDAVRPGVLIRIPCQELEAWYWGDLQAVSQAMGKDVTSYARKKKYRNPDAIVDPKECLRRLFPEMRQLADATKIGKAARIEENTSESFQCFVTGVRKMCEK